MKKEIIYAEFKAGQYYHVYNRAVGSDRLFHKHENYAYFLRKYRYHLTDCLKTYAYCLIPNHFHFLIKVNDDLENPQEVISVRFRRFFGGFANAINIQQKRKGSLFIKPFKRILITDNKHKIDIINYIHSNPVHHKLCAHPSQHVWNSYLNVLEGKKEEPGKDILSTPDIDLSLLKTRFDLINNHRYEYNRSSPELPALK
jgi:putative transposase